MSGTADCILSVKVSPGASKDILVSGLSSLDASALLTAASP